MPKKTSGEEKFAVSANRDVGFDGLVFGTRQSNRIAIRKSKLTGRSRSVGSIQYIGQSGSLPLTIKRTILKIIAPCKMASAAPIA
jgi:hypothetical protein